MRPLTLSIEGFACFKDRQDLDLTDLSLFALTGPTGAGKSSVLDAITFALYGRVPRVGKEMSKLVSLGRDRLSVILDVLVSGERLRVMRKLRRGKPTETMLELIVEGADPKSIASGVRDVDAEITKRLGLGYDAFTQAVILPQGQFAEFLHSEPAKRRKILSDLLRLRVYELMRSNAAERKKTLDAQVTATTRVLGDEYATATPEALAAARAELLVLETSLETARAKVTAARREADEIGGLREKTVALGAAEQKLAGLAADEPLLRAGESKLEAARRAAPVIPRLESADAAHVHRESVKRKGEEAQAELELATRTLEAAAARRIEAEEAATQTVALREELRALDEAIGKLGPLSAARERMARAEHDVVECDRLLAAETQRSEDAAREVEAAARDAADREHEIGVLAFDVARWRRVDGLRERAGELVALRTQATSTGVAEQEAQQAATKASDDEVRTRDAWEEARTTHVKLVGRVETYDEELRDAERADAAAALRRTLHEGEPCPVCAQTVTTVPAVAEDARVAELTKKRDTARRDEEKARKHLERASKEHASAETAAKTALDAKERAKAAAEAARDAASSAARHLEESIAADVAAGDDPIEVRVLAVVRKLAENRHRHDALAAALEAATRRRDEAERMSTRASAESAELRARHAQSRTRGEEAKSEVAILETEIARATGGRDPISSRAANVATIEALELRRDSARREEGDAERVARAASARQRECVAAETTASEQASARRAEAEQAAKEAGFDDDAAVREAALSRSALDDLARLVEGIRAMRAEAEATVRAVRTELGDRRVGEPEAAAAVEKLSTTEIEEREAVRAHAGRARDIETMAGRVARASKLAEDLKTQSDERNVYARLANDLRSENFQAFLMEEAFRDLAAGASIRLQSLTARYGLELKDDSFVVIDHDNAQERRSADTLSGGETFLASLALALELSAQVQRAAGAVALDSVFIDEGFGTLDPETLDTVAGALESLPTGGRMVGIITHLADLSARLPARVVVERGASGSTLRLET